MKKAFVLLITTLLLFTAPNIVLGTDNSFRIGMGIPYGVIGVNLQQNISEHFAFTEGLGLAPGGLGYQVGGRFIFRNGSYVGIYYGVVGYIDYFFEYENFEGLALGIGKDFGKFNGEIIYIASKNLPSDAVEEDASDVKISLGYKF